ncbi:MAG: 4Fe-4S dicluster domain-containing protein [Desulfobacterales bacterium]|uniref:4Fe-4S dicluster domain-containing protein n=1 Tax=Candidatus Desulfatibia profunda TaxID=2841695 RepID=A0A8J6TMX5_9BACT|nr:4Fe-4S dicluster domain-containing protein [Candidatus Desulfatibia profunda]MBL7180235.1 4Fe-4S dicluster domain-containing protein [Desulfobacterales bacterium]
MVNQTVEKVRWPQGTVDKARKLIGDRGNHFLKRMEGETGANISACFQCFRCTNACPVSHYMDIKPHQVIRYIQLGWREELLQSATIWVCLSCEMCTTYCPNEVQVAETINHLRNMAAHSSVAPREKQLALFHQTFLEALHHFGRVNEFWLMGALNLKPGVLKEKIRTGALAEEMALGLLLLRKGKLKLMPRRCRAMAEIRKLYRQQRGEMA